MEFKKFLSQFNIPEEEIIEYLVSNDWFDRKPSKQNGKIILSEEETEFFNEKINSYLSKGSYEEILKEFDGKFPETSKIFRKFISETKIPEKTRFYVVDFLITYLKKDILLYSNVEVEELLNIAADNLSINYIETLTFFLSYVRQKRKTRYYKNYGVSSRKMKDNGAYSFNEYIKILYYLFNENYIKENEMYQKAARSKNYADTWLFLSIHFICSLRMTDLERIYHPKLPKDPETILEEVEKGTFTDKEAREVLLSITQRMCVLPLKPNKTKKASNIPDIKFIIPHSCEVHIGTLFALVEAHQQVSGKTGPIIRKISSFEAISRNMGEEIGLLFLQNNFRCRKANKSFLQGIEHLSQDILGEEGPNVKGYILAALARSHKASYGNFASTAATYLRDETLSGMTPTFVAFELFERGILSCVPSMLLNLATNGEYKELQPVQQTSLMDNLGISANKSDRLVAVVNRSQERAQTALIQALADEIPVLDILHNIGSGTAISKNPECLCMLSAVYKVCPYENAQCIGCDYEISTKSTLFLVAGEYKRMLNLYNISENPIEKEKYEIMVRDLIVPKIEELLIYIKEIYGEKVFNEYQSMVMDYVK